MAQLSVFFFACLAASAQQAVTQSCAASSPRNEEPSGPQVSIVSVTFSGAAQLAPSEQTAIADSIRQDTIRGSVEAATEQATERVRAAWQNRGYFRVRVSGEATTFTSNAVSTRISLDIQVDEGQQYRLGAITFRNNRAVAKTKSLRALFPIKGGDLFSRESIATGLANLRKAYGQLGYINFTPVPETEVDDVRGGDSAYRRYRRRKAVLRQRCER
jgi:outer membrane protein insertion porin family